MGEQEWYGCIPSLTVELAFEYCISNLKTQPETREITDEEEIKSIDNLLQSTDALKTQLVSKYKSKEIKYFEFYKNFKDTQEENSKVVIFVDNKYKIIRVIIFNKKQEVAAIATCEIDNNGLVKISFSYQPKQGLNKIELEKIEKNIAIQVYIIIRDIYHQHTHHEYGKDHSDILLPPVQAKNDKEAIKKINDKYQEKIITYHEKLHEILKDPTQIPYGFFDEIKHAKGEMTYAISFIKLFKDKIKHYEKYHFSYLNGIRALDILATDVKLRYSFEINRKTTEMNEIIVNINKYILLYTIFIGILTFIIAMDAYLRLDNNLREFVLFFLLPLCVGSLVLFVAYFYSSFKKR